MLRIALTLLLLVAPLAHAGEVSEIAVAAQRTWRAGDGGTLIALAHPKLIARIAELQQLWLEQKAQGNPSSPWVRFPDRAPTIESFKALSPADKARSFFACMHEILSDHAGFNFTFAAEGEAIICDRATVTVIEHAISPEGKIRDVRYPFILERIGNRWGYVSGGSEQMHVDMQLMLLAP